MNGAAIKAIRIALNVLAAFFFALEQFGRRGLAWVDAYYPDEDIDELIKDMEEQHARNLDVWEHGDNTVHLPRKPR